MLKSKSGQWTAGAAALCVLLLVAAWFLLIAPKRSEAADLQEQTTSRLALNDQLNLEIAKLRAQNSDLPQQQARLAAIKLEMPEDRAQSATLRKITDLASASGVTVTNYTQGAAVAPGAAQGGAAAPTPTSAGSAGAAIGVFSIPTTITVSADYFSAARFVKKLQTELTRAFLITSVIVNPDPEGEDGDVTLALAGQLYVLRTGVTSSAVVSPTPTPTSSTPVTPTPTGSTTGSPTPTPTGSPTGTPTVTTTP